MPQGLNDVVDLLGRVLLSLIFLLSAFHKIMAFPPTQDAMRAHGITAMTPLFLFGAIAFELAGGLSLLLGFKPRIGALLLIVFLIPATYYFHNFWAVKGAEAPAQQIHFMKNLAILGGLFTVLAHGAGAYSFDGRRAGGAAK